MRRKIFELVWNVIGMSAMGMAVGFGVHGQWVESAFSSCIGVVALICWRLIDGGLERD